MPSRRRVLGLAAGVLATTSGCVAAPVSGGEPAGVADTTTLPEEGKTRGEADPITVERTITDSHFKYVPSNDTVRYAATTFGGEVADYRYIPFERWADVETLTVAAQALDHRLEQHFENLKSVVVGTDNPEGESQQVSVSHETRLDESGDVIDEPAIGVSRLVEATPRSITATVEFSGHRGTRTYPAFVVWYAHIPLAFQEENDSE